MVAVPLLHMDLESLHFMRRLHSPAAMEAMRGLKARMVDKASVMLLKFREKLLCGIGRDSSPSSA